MKNLIKLLAIGLLAITTTSCWDFNREQRIKDAKAQGEAVLVESENSKKALIEQARAENEAAELQAKAKIKIAEAEATAEIARAKGVAEANQIIGESLKGNKDYLEYLKIDNLKHTNKGDRIYIPTEAMLPITERK